MIKHDSIRFLVTQKISIALQKMGHTLTEDEIYKALVEPPQSNLGDLAFGCFILAKNLKKAPVAVAAEIAQNMEADTEVEKVQAAGPYLNITLKAEAHGKLVLNDILLGSYFKKQLLESSPRTMIEYSQPNTHKELHVGHMRNLCLGDSIVRLFKYAGRDIASATFPGDMGTHVAKCLWYLKKHNQEPAPAGEKGEWLGRMYSRANLLLEDQNGTPDEDTNRQELTAILHQLEGRSGPYYDLWLETREWSIALMKKVYEWADVNFDHWYFESEMDSESVKWVKELYADGKLEKSNGAIGMNLESEKLGFCMLLKTDGTGLYATKDLLLAKKKFEDNIEKSVYIVDMRQALHFKQVFRVLEILGFPQAKNCFHLQYNYVELPDGAMSSRKGNIVPLTSLVHNMEKHVKETYLARYENGWSPEEVEMTAAQVAKGAIFYGMLRMDTNKKIVFDMNEWLKLDGESGPFIQYSHARIASLGRKFSRNKASEVNWSLLTHPSERQVFQSLAGFNSQIALAAENFKPAAVCTYLYELAKRFNVFYHECPIGNEKDEALRQTRLALAEAVGMTLKQGLSLIGMPAPEKM